MFYIPDQCLVLLIGGRLDFSPCGELGCETTKVNRCQGGSFLRWTSSLVKLHQHFLNSYQFKIQGNSILF